MVAGAHFGAIAPTFRSECERRPSALTDHHELNWSVLSPKSYPRNQPFFIQIRALLKVYRLAETAAPTGCGTPVVRKACRRDAATEQGISSVRVMHFASNENTGGRIDPFVWRLGHWNVSWLPGSAPTCGSNR